MRPHYVTRKGQRQVGLLNQWSGTHWDVAMSCLPECMDWPIPCLHDLTNVRNLFSQMWHKWHPMISQCHVYLNPFTGTHSLLLHCLTRSLSPNVTGHESHDDIGRNIHVVIVMDGLK